MPDFWKFFLKKKQFSYVLIVALVVAGVYSLARMPKESTPSIDIGMGVVSTSFPGAAAEDVETLVTDKLENQISNISNIDTLTSTSNTGFSAITVQFTANADITQSIQDLRDAVSKAQSDLPSEVNTPTVTRVNFNNQPILIATVSGDLPETEFADLGRRLSDEIKTVTGVSDVTVSGVPDREVNVIVNKEALSAYGLRLIDVASAISANNASLPAGHITTGNVNYDVNFKGDIKDPAQIGDIAVANKNGQPIYLRDIASISDGLAPDTSYSRVSVDGKPANQSITLTVYKQAGGNVANIANAVKAKLDSLQKTELKGLTVLVPPATDQGKEVAKQLGDLTQTGFETVSLVVIVLLLTIGWRESLVAALSIPLSFFIAFIGLYFTGNTLNFISLFALILAVGILVDSGIVVTEAIHARMKIYGNPMKAAEAALDDYAWPLVAGTMSTVAVFVPLFFISGIIGKFIAGIPYTLIFVLVASIFVALGTVPLIAILFTKEKPNRLELIQEEYTEKVTHWYKEKLHAILLNRSLQNKFLSALAVLFVFSLLLPVTGLVQSIFFAQSDQDYLYINIEKPQGTVLSQTDLVVREVEEILYSDPDIGSFTTTVGESSALTGSSQSGSKYGSITVNLPAGHKKTSTEILADLQKRLAPVKDADIQVLQSSSGPSSGAPVQIKFTGDDLMALIVTADKADHLLSSIPGASNITTSTKDNGTEFALTVDRAKASAVGLNPLIIAQTLRAAINGTTATTIKEPSQDIDVIVKLNLNSNYTSAADTAQTTIDSINNISIQTANGSVLLGSLLKNTLDVSNASISHENKKRIETVSAYTTAGATTEGVLKIFQSRIGELSMPEGVSVSYGGEDESINQSFSEMFVALIAGLVLMFMILVLVFNSFRYTAYLLMVVPLSLIGVLDGLALTGQPLSFPSMLGFIALGGVIINHSIILMDSMSRMVEEEAGKPLIDIVVEASATRLRPIFLTTVTTVIGMIPLAHTSDMWGPLAYTIMFGLSFAIVLTLVLVPVLFFRAPHHGK